MSADEDLRDEVISVAVEAREMVDRADKALREAESCETAHDLLANIDDALHEINDARKALTEARKVAAGLAMAEKKVTP